METRGWMLLRVLINRYNPKAKDALLRYLPHDETEMLLSQDIRSDDFLPILFQPQRLIERLHYSWIKPLLSHFSESLQPLVIAALSPEQRKGFQEKSLPSLTKPVRSFFIQQLYSHLDAEKHLPLEYLPETELSPLIHWKKSELIDLVDFLGLHDLAAEIRHIVDKNMLNNLYSCLSQKKMYYLKICLHQKELLVVPKLEFDARQKDCEKLGQVLHRRGLARLGKALAGQHPDLVWYLIFPTRFLR
jgi:hypothetical protein